MASQQEKDAALNPSTVSAAYETMLPKWQMISALLGGTCTMREVGKDYLPQHSAEGEEDYANRLAQSVLYNVTELTLNSLVGRIFREPIEMIDPDEKILELSRDVDSLKSDINMFSQAWFREGMAKGYAGILIDMPAIVQDEKAKRTRADDLRENRRPYWSLLSTENIIFMHYERVNGVETLMHARIAEYKVEMNGFVQEVTTQIRVLTPGKWELYENEKEKDKRKKDVWVKVEEGTYDLDIIPIVMFYTNKESCMLCKPPLEDLAYLNVRHWQSNSDQINVLTVARFPMLAASGAVQDSSKNTMPIGPRQLLSMRDPNGRFYYVEHTGRAIASGKDDLEMLEDRMAAYGAEFLRRQISGRTAFERAQDAGEATSNLKSMATQFEVSLNTALEVTGMWLGIDKVGTVKVNKHHTVEEDKSDPLTILGSARERGDISLKTFLDQLKRGKSIDDSVDVDEEIARIEQEREDGLTVDPSQPYSTKVKQTSGEIDEAATKGVTDATTPKPKPVAKPAAKKKSAKK